MSSAEQGPAQAVESILSNLDYLDHGDDLRPLIRRLAEVVAKLVPAEAAPPPVELRVGDTYDLLLRVRCTVTDTDDDGSIQVQLEQRMFTEVRDRELCLDPDEIVGGARRE